MLVAPGDIETIQYVQAGIMTKILLECAPELQGTMPRLEAKPKRWLLTNKWERSSKKKGEGGEFLAITY